MYPKKPVNLYDNTVSKETGLYDNTVSKETSVYDNTVSKEFNSNCPYLCKHVCRNGQCAVSHTQNHPKRIQICFVFIDE